MCVHAYMVYYSIPCMHTTCKRSNALRYATRCIVRIVWGCMLHRPYHLVIPRSQDDVLDRHDAGPSSPKTKYPHTLLHYVLAQVL
jgi:hypothetical protein